MRSFAALLSPRWPAPGVVAGLAITLLASPAGAQARPVGTYVRGPLTVVLTDTSFRALMGDQLGAAGMLAYRGDSVMMLQDSAGPRACAAGAMGSYAFVLRGDTLRLTTITEPCPGRRGVFAGGPLVRSDMAGPRLLDGVTIIDGTGTPPQANMSIVVRNGLIADVYPSGTKPAPAGTRVVPLQGRWVIPGLIDAHVHLATDPSGGDNRAVITAKLRTELRGGITSVRDMAGDARALAELARGTLVGDLEGPDIHFAAIWAGADFMSDPRVSSSTRGTAPGSEPWMRTVTPGTDWKVASSEARGSGVRGIKLYADVAPAVARGTVPAAHAAGLRVWSHATTFPARPSDLVNAGVDVLSHAPLLAWEAVDSLPNYRARYAAPFEKVAPDHPRIMQLLQRMAERSVLFEPTLFVFMRDSGNRVMGAWAAAVTRQAAAAGVPLVAGTDDMIAASPDSLPHLHRELELLVEAGLTPAQAIAAATSHAARALGIEARTGAVRTGLSADLVVLEADPVADIRNTRRIERVLKRGVEVKR